MDTKSPFRFSLRTLLLAVVAVSVGTAAMVSAAPWWESAVMTITGTLLTAAILLAGFRTGSSRAFWTGFAVCGCSYLLMLIVQIDNQRVANQLLPGKLLNMLANVMHPMSIYPAMLAAPTATYTPSYSAPAPNLPPPTVSPNVQFDVAPPNAAATTPAEPSNCGEEGDETNPTTTSLAGDDVYQAVPANGPYMPANPQPASTVPWAAPVTYYATPYGMPSTDDPYLRQQRCLAIGHCLTALLFGMIGGWFAVWLQTMRDRAVA